MNCDRFKLRAVWMHLLVFGCLLLPSISFSGSVGIREAESASLSSTQYGIPEGFSAAAWQLVDSAFWEIEGRPFVAFRLVEQDSIRGHFSGAPLDGVYHGWLQSVGDGESVALSTDGRLYEVAEILGEVEYRLLNTAPSDLAQFERKLSIAPRQQVSLSSSALCLATGQGERARRDFALALRSDEVRLVQGFDAVQWDAEIFESVVPQARETCYSLLVRGRYQESLELVDRVQNCFKSVDLTMQINPYLGYLDLRWVEPLQKDLRLRLSGRKELGDGWSIEAGNEHRGDRLITKLLDAKQPINSSSPAEELLAISHEGESLVPRLIDASVLDWRYSSLWLDRDPDITFLQLRSVSEIALELLRGSWPGMPVGWLRDGRQFSFEEHAEWLRSQWAKHEDLALKERLLSNLRDSSLTLYGFNKALEQIVFENEGAELAFSEAERREAGVHIRGRLRDVPENPSTGTAADILAETAVLFAHMEGHDCIETLRELSQVLAKELTSDAPFAWGGVSGSYGTVIAQRIALGDTTALAELRSMFDHVDRARQIDEKFFRAGWEFPNEEVGLVVSEGVRLARESLRGPGKSFPSLSNFWSFMPLDWVVETPALREQFREDLLDESPCATLTVRKPWLGTGYRFTSLNHQWSERDRDFTIIGEVSFGEYLASQFANRYVGESDYWGLSRDERALVIDRFIEMIDRPSSEFLRVARETRFSDAIPLYLP